MYYILLSVAAVLFATQFLFNQQWQNEYGNSWNTALIFTIITSAAGFISLLPFKCFNAKIFDFSILMSIILSVVNILYSYVSIKAFYSVNLSLYSVFAMLGGMLLPFLYGIIFNGEPLTYGKIISCPLIVISLLFTLSKGNVKGGFIYYISVFILNGLSGVISAIHQGNINAADSVSFIALSRLVSFIICVILWGVTSRKFLRISRNGMLYSLGFALFCTFGNLLTLLSLKHLPASVQYPVITGGVMALSFVISYIRKEQITHKNVISAIIAVFATIVVTL